MEIETPRTFKNYSTPTACPRLHKISFRVPDPTAASAKANILAPMEYEAQIEFCNFSKTQILDKEINIQAAECCSADTPWACLF